MNLNKVIIVGRVTADPQLRTTTGGSSVASLSIATNRTWTDKSGKKQEEVEFHHIVLWARQAEIASQFVVKGSLLMIEGRLQTRKWQDKQGQTRYTTEIIGERLQLGPKPSSASSTYGSDRQDNDSTQADGDEDIPIINVDEDDIKPEDLPF